MDSWAIWRESLKSPRYILAPMVDHSELPWRMLSREYGCQAAYTPMFHAANFSTSKKFRQKYFTTCQEDRPLIVQFCANNAQILLDAAKYVENSCDAIDINLGCPQEIAKRGHYGAFLQDDWTLINEMVTTLRNNISDTIAISCKIRRFEDVKKTIEYAKMLEKSGCNFVAIHGRTREQRGCRTGLADWPSIKAVKENLTIPVIANGNIQSLNDAEECLLYTKADAIMTAEGNLYNPCILRNIHPLATVIAKKYLNYVEKYPIIPGMAKSHIFKLFHRCISIEENYDLRAKLGSSNTLEKLYEVVECFEKRYSIVTNNFAQQDDKVCDYSLPINTLPIPPYYCQPHYRYSSEQTTEEKEKIKGDKVDENSKRNNSNFDDKNLKPKEIEKNSIDDIEICQKRIKLDKN